MTTDDKPTADKLKWNRRKDARPAEIIDAAMDTFAEKGFAGTKLDEVARRAGIAKGTLYRYFATKDEMFRAVAQQAIVNNLEAIERTAAAFEGRLGEIAPLLLRRFAEKLGDRRVPAIARMVIGESRTFPDLARIWHDAVAARMLTLLADLIRGAQARGEVRAGDPRLHAFSLVGPMIVALLFREVFGADGEHAPDLDALAVQHAATVLRGLLISPNGRPD